MSPTAQDISAATASPRLRPPEPHGALAPGHSFCIRPGAGADTWPSLMLAAVLSDRGGTKEDLSVSCAGR